MSSTRNWWPIGLTTFILLFLAVTIGMVLILSGERVDLVSENTYEKGQKHSARMEVLARTSALPVKPAIRYDAESRECLVLFPDALRGSTGTVTFFRTSDSRLDFSHPLALDAGGVQRVPTASVQHGWWTVQLSWLSGGLEYYLEDRINIQ